MDEVVALRQPESVEALGQFGVSSHLGSKYVNGLVHVEQETSDRVFDVVVAGWDARGIHTRVCARRLDQKQNQRVHFQLNLSVYRREGGVHDTPAKKGEAPLCH